MSKKKERREASKHVENMAQNEQPEATEQVEGGQEAVAAASEGSGEIDWKDKYLRLLAEFDNYKKRIERERQVWAQEGQARLAYDLLQVMDDFERALEAMERMDDLASLKEGVRLIHQKLEKVFREHEIHPIEAVGAPFDPEIHEALTTVPAPSEEHKNRVVEQVQKGYTHRGKVLRHPKVVVGK